MFSCVQLQISILFDPVFLAGKDQNAAPTGKCISLLYLMFLS